MANNKYQNGSGYNDPTAFYGTKSVVKEENELDKKAFNLIKVLKYMIGLAGFELVSRIELRDKKSGKEFR